MNLIDLYPNLTRKLKICNKLAFFQPVTKTITCPKFILLLSLFLLKITNIPTSFELMTSPFTLLLEELINKPMVSFHL